MTRVSSRPKYIIFDGTCGLCDKAVSFIFRHDKREIFRFAPAGGETALRLLHESGLAHDLTETTVLFFSENKHFEKSDAIIEICRLLGFPYSLMVLGKIMPRFMRDAIYEFVARHRFSIFGRVNTCTVATPENAHRFMP